MIIHDYESRSGKELVKDYILNLPEEEKIDGLSVLKDMEDNKLDSLLIKRWENKYMKYIFANIIEYSILLQMKIICICFMHVENRKIKPKKQILI